MSFTNLAAAPNYAPTNTRALAANLMPGLATAGNPGMSYFANQGMLAPWASQMGAQASALGQYANAVSAPPGPTASPFTAPAPAVAAPPASIASSPGALGGPQTSAQIATQELPYGSGGTGGGNARGGPVPHRFGGGQMMGMSPSQAMPSWTHAAMYGMDRSFPGSGLVHSATPGRADQVMTHVPSGSYVLPSDFVSSIGGGNSLAGGKMLDAAMRTGPDGVPMSGGGRHGGIGIPRPPRPATFAAGGGANEHGGPVRVALSGGEYVVAPHVVQMIGRGDLRRGFAILDEAVMQRRRHEAAKLKTLPGPVR